MQDARSFLSVEKGICGHFDSSSIKGWTFCMLCPCAYGVQPFLEGAIVEQILRACRLKFRRSN